MMIWAASKLSVNALDCHTDAKQSGKKIQRF